MKKNLSCFITFAAILCLFMQHKATAQIIDQQYTPDPITGGAFYNANAPLGQSFTPQTLAIMNFAQFQLSDDRFAAQPLGGTFVVRVRQGDSLRAGSAGPILGMSDPIAFPPGFGTGLGPGGAIVSFSFPTPVTLVLNTPFTLELVRISGAGDFLLYSTQPGGYAGGAGINGGTDAATVGDTEDFWFREGLISTAAPEPATLPLLATVLTSIWLGFRRHILKG